MYCGRRAFPATGWEAEGECTRALGGGSALHSSGRSGRSWPDSVPMSRAREPIQGRGAVVTTEAQGSSPSPGPRSAASEDLCTGQSLLKRTNSGPTGDPWNTGDVITGADHPTSGSSRKMREPCCPLKPQAGREEAALVDGKPLSGIWNEIWGLGSPRAGHRGGTPVQQEAVPADSSLSSALGTSCCFPSDTHQASLFPKPQSCPQVAK